MADHKNRYPGAQPFSDDDFSGKVFFGRESASGSLADKIMANRMVVVYARSGVGKTSLLNAGVAPRLREEGYLPLFVRVNDVREGPFRSVLAAISTEAERQGVEYVPGLSDSFWAFFKTGEFWRGDLLLTPVLILDQFEELFTLQGEQARAHFLDELSYLTRGVRPPSPASSACEDLSEHPPSLRIVLSVREDYLGFLEEAAEHIPQILDARFRLVPLDLLAAREAIVGPAGIDDPDLETRPFALDGDAISSILDYLSQRRTRTVAETRRYVEPFQLQLICRRIEQIAAARQKASTPDLRITMADIGGEAALTETLSHFYRDAIRTLPDRRGRRACRRLCEDYLISPEGRRLSLEENEILRQIDLPRGALGRLVGSRLLRSENRSDSTYYELSHDALVQPILAARQRKTTTMGWSGVGFGGLLFLLSSIVVILFTHLFIFEYQFSADALEFTGELIALSVVMLGGLGIVVASAILLRSSARSLSRYRRARQATLADSGYQSRQRGGFFSGLLVFFAGLSVLVFGLLVVALLGLIVIASFEPAALPAAEELEVADYVRQIMSNGIGLDVVVYLIASVAVVLVGGRLVRWGVYRLGSDPGQRRRQASEASYDTWSTRAMVHAATGVVFGVLLLFTAALLGAFSLLILHCGHSSPGSLPAWAPSAWFSMLVVDCMAGYPEGVAGELLFNIVLIIASLFVATGSLRRAVAATRRLFHGSPAPPTIAPDMG